MPAYNLGMLTAGLPDLARRQVSQEIRGEGYYQGQQKDWLSNWQGRWDKAAPTYVQTNAGGWTGGDASALQSLVNASSGQTGWTADSDGSWSSGLINSAQAGDQQARDVIGAFGGSFGTYTAPSGYYDDSARKALDAEKARQQAQWKADADARAANQQAIQQSYNQTNGGGFMGGVINASYGTPFGGAVGAPAAVDGVTMPQNQPWGVAGYGGPTGGTSQAGFGGGWGQNNQPGQPQGWGGPFTNRNPWAAS